MDWVVEPLSQAFMMRALICGAVVGGLCAAIGVFVVQRGMSFIGDGGEFLEGALGSAQTCAFGKHATGGTRLDKIHPVFDISANLFSHLPRAGRDVLSDQIVF